MYAKIENNEVIKYPYVFNDLKEDNPLISFPGNALENESIRSEYGIEKVAHTDHANKGGFKYTETTPIATAIVVDDINDSSEEDIDCDLGECCCLCVCLSHLH